jgi:hypothetical protein
VSGRGRSEQGSFTRALGRPYESRDGVLFTYGFVMPVSLYEFGEHAVDGVEVCEDRDVVRVLYGRVLVVGRGWPAKLVVLEAI